MAENETKPDDVQHWESDYVKRYFDEPIHHALTSILLYRPWDPRDFLAQYLRYWVHHVRDHRRRIVAEHQVQKLLEDQLDWNVGVIAEQARVLEQKDLDEARRRAEEEARLAEIEQARQKALLDTITRKVMETLRKENVDSILAKAQEAVEELAWKKWVTADKARKREEAAERRRKRAEETEEMNAEEGQEEADEEEEEEE